MSRNRLGRSQVLSLPHGYATRGLYGPLRLAMAQNDADRVGTPPPLVGSAGGVVLYSEASAGESPDPCRWPQPVAC